MSRTLTASDRTALIRLASGLPAGSHERISILEMLKNASDLTPQEFMAKLEEGFTASKTLRVYSDLANGEHDDVYIIGGERYKLVRKSNQLLRGSGPWAGTPSEYVLEGKWLIVAPPWQAKALDEAEAKGTLPPGKEKVKGKWSYVSSKTPAGYGSTIFMENSVKGPPKIWLKVISESR